jgi:hypothetical protein
MTNATRLMLVALCLTFSAPSLVRGDSSVFLEASFGVGGETDTTVNSGAPPPPQTFNQSDLEKDFTVLNFGHHLDVGGRGSASSQASEVTAMASATASTGTLEVSIEGDYKAQTIGPTNSFGSPAARGGASFFGGASASWSDFATFTTAGLPLGAPLILHGGFILDGMLTVVGDGVGDAFVHLVNPEIIGGSADFRVDTQGGPRAMTLVADIVPTLFAVQNGQEVPFSVSISVGAAQSDGSGLEPGDSVEGSAFALFSDTLRWGGISSVIDGNTGNVINDWTVTSQSGFDYSQPAPVAVPVPWPATLTLAAIGALLGLFVHCRSRAASGSGGASPYPVSTV